MIRVEPKLLAMLKETSVVKDIIYIDRQKNDQLSNEIATTTINLEVGEAQLKEKELQWSQLKRCRLCAGGGHERTHLKGSTASSKHGLGVKDFEVEEDEKSHSKEGGTTI